MPGTVTVASKVPMNVIVQLDEFVERDEPVMGGGYRTVREARPRQHQRVVINGCAFFADKGPRHQMANGYALTHNVDADLFAEWVKQKGGPLGLDYLRSDEGRAPLIFALEKSTSVEAKAREQKDVRSGLEPVNPNKLPPGIQKADVK